MPGSAMKKALAKLAATLGPPKTAPAVDAAWGAAAAHDAWRPAPFEPPPPPPALPKVPPGPPRPRPPQVSMRDAVSRWYGNYEGGFDRAVEESQRAMQEHPLPNYQFYGPWHPEDVDRKFPVSYSLLDAGTEGSFVSDNSVRIGKAGDQLTRPNETLEHELTHGLTLGRHNDELNTRYPDNPTPLDRNRRIISANARVDGGAEFWADSGEHVDLDSTVEHLINKKHSVGPDDARSHVDRHLRNYISDHAHYLTSAEELDPRIAEVRRHYTWHTGEGVRTPEEAEKAWKWFGERLGQYADGAPDSQATISPMAYRLYDGLPEGVKRIMYARMTHIPAALGPIGAALASGQQQQQSQR